MDPELVKFLLGGGGSAGVVYAVISYVKDRRRDRVMDEDTALARLTDDYRRKDNEARRAWRLVNWYRTQYALTRDLLTIEQKQRFPPSPPVEVEYPPDMNT